MVTRDREQIHVRTRATSLGFARVGVATFWTTPMGVFKNLERHIEMARRSQHERLQLVVFPELGLTGYACRDGFRAQTLQQNALDALHQFCTTTTAFECVFLVGLPLALSSGLYNVAAIVNRGQVIAFVPKSFLAARAEWQEDEWFVPASHLPISEVELPWQREPIPIGTDILINVRQQSGEEAFVLGVEICADGWQSNSPGDRHAHNGATVIANLSASNWILGKDKWREKLFAGNSGRQKSAYLYSTMAGDSTAGVTWDGHGFICEDGTVLALTKRWYKPDASDLAIADIDIEKLKHDRRLDGEWAEAQRLNIRAYRRIESRVRDWKPDIHDFRRPLPRMPFVPLDPSVMRDVCLELLEGLIVGIMGRLWSMNDGKPVHVYLGLSGGSDSTLVYLILCETYDRLGWSRTFIHAERFPGPASSSETQQNSYTLAQVMGTSTSVTNITPLATRALLDSGHEPCWDCLMCENAQARARTYELMTRGFVAGTGDMTEKCLGWSTYNGDQMSMYDVIANVPKTLVRYMIRAYLEHMTTDPTLKQTLGEILSTIISPELRKPKDGEQIQSSEEQIGPYDLNDFFLYHTLRTWASPARMYFLARVAFSRVEREGDQLYNNATILKWLRNWFKRFYTMQYKRNASADAVLVGSIGVGAHDKLRLPSDGDPEIFLDEIDRLSQEH